jgi:hypothetical protein
VAGFYKHCNEHVYAIKVGSFVSSCVIVSCSRKRNVTLATLAVRCVFLCQVQRPALQAVSFFGDAVARKQGMEIKLHAFLTSIIIADGWSASHSDRCTSGKEKHSCPCRESSCCRPATWWSHYSGVSTRYSVIVSGVYLTTLPVGI